LAQLRAALLDRPDYVAFGPVFGTRSKQQPAEVVGPELLGQAHALTRAAGIPLVAIGGIDLPRARQIAGDCELIATIAALHPEPGSLAGVSEAASALARVFRSQLA
jgi:thiamine-phosphate pyrophosphorylase